MVRARESQTSPCTMFNAMCCELLKLPGCLPSVFLHPLPSNYLWFGPYRYSLSIRYSY